MTTSPQIFHGEWWVPEEVAHSDIYFPDGSNGVGKKFTGTLTYYGDGETVLELYHVLSNFPSILYHENEVMWGQDANGTIFSLFCVRKKDHNILDFTISKFSVELILINSHVLHVTDVCFDRCLVQFTYLKNWAFFCKRPNGEILVDSSIDDGVKWVLQNRVVKYENTYDLTISQKTELMIESSKGLSIIDGLKQVKEFTQFLSIALYCEQNPSTIQFIDSKKKFDKKDFLVNTLLFEKNVSIDPKDSKLIRFNELYNSIPSMLSIWHKNYEALSPISGYLVASLKKNRYFGAPDFLIIAQALDGYFKRFLGKKIDERIHRYEKQIEILLNRFKNVDVIKKCHIKPEVLKDSRHKYSHLLPDDVPSQAVSGDELYWLTEKSKILLVCCILDLLGLSSEEINLCCNNSPIKELAENFELEEQMMP